MTLYPEILPNLFICSRNFFFVNSLYYLERKSYHLWTETVLFLPFYSGLQGFWWGISSHLNYCSPVSTLWLFSGCFPVFCLFVCFSSSLFEYDVSGCGILSLYFVWGSLSFLNLYVCTSHKILEVLCHYLFKYFLLNLTFLLLEFWFCI